MRVLIACEFSGIVREAFRRRGHDAVSCDLLPTINSHGPHIQDDVRNHLDDGWDLMIAHPPCTYLTVSAAWAFMDGPYHQRVNPGTLVGAARRQARDEALAFVQALLNADVPRIALENPIGSINSQIRPADQIIQPFEFGHPESKATCLWLKGLPKLRPTDVLAKPASGRWDNQTASGQNKLTPTADRWARRSLTYPGIADAMAIQWGADQDFALEA